MRAGRVAFRLLAAVVLCALAVAAEAGSWYEDYLDGVKAVEAGRWDAAVRLLESARSQQPRSALHKKTYGVNFIEYLPSFQLGLAHLGRGDRAAALRFLEEEEAQGVVQKSKEAARFRETAERLRAGARVEPARVETPAPAFTVAPAATAIPTVRPPQPVATVELPPSTPPLRTPTPRTPEPPPAAPPAATVARAAAPIPAVAPAATPTAPPLPAPPPPELRQGLLALFRGELGEAIGLLEAVPLSGDPRDADVHAFLAVAYARSALAEPDRERRAGHERTALEHIRQARQLRPGYRLSERLTSPRVRALLSGS